jgi:CheY-like chemotaxis protein
MMGGVISLRSSPGKGSTFSVQLRLPLDDQAPAEPAPPAALGAFRMLVVDDNPVNLRVLSEQLRGLKIRFDCVSSAGDALRQLNQAHDEGDPYQVVITDYLMPGMDGEMLGRAIKAAPALAGTGLILITSSGPFGDRARFKDAGFAAVLTKPVKSSALLRALTDVCFAARPPDAIAACGAAAEASAAAQIGRAKHRVLLAEDNAVNQKVALRLLERLGCSVDVAASGSEAVEKYRAAPYDIVFMDCQMPLMDGYEATAAIRRLESAGAHIPIVALTANAMQGDRDVCLAQGMDDYIAKPINTGDLIRVLQRWLGQKTSEPETAVV